MNTKRATPILSIVKPAPVQDVIEAIEYLLHRAIRGEIVGLAYAAEIPGRRYITDLAGEAHRDSVKAAGMTHLLTDRVAQRFRGEG